MSLVTNLLLSCSAGEGDDRAESPDALGPGLKAIRDYCEQTPALGGLPRSIDELAGGPKRIECNVYAWGTNYLDLAGFRAAVAAAPWHRPEAVQVFAMGQEEDRFETFDLRGDRDRVAGLAERAAAVLGSIEVGRVGTAEASAIVEALMLLERLAESGDVSW